jgi:hypothetical protein
LPLAVLLLLLVVVVGESERRRAIDRGRLAAMATAEGRQKKRQ